jgi:undecaprenyl pyrophosphate phosphatase UppP
LYAARLLKQGVNQSEVARRLENVPAIEIASLGATGTASASYLSAKFLTKYFKSQTLTPYALYCCVSGVAGFMALHH